eukprot:SAG31_NODE_28284_length_412_cov_0.990415_1_plen_22_part_10
MHTVDMTKGWLALVSANGKGIF